MHFSIGGSDVWTIVAALIVLKASWYIIEGLAAAVRDSWRQVQAKGKAAQ
jgi:hypothetical protein